MPSKPLVRPDGYLAFHKRGFDQNALAPALKRWVESPSTHSQAARSSGA